MLTDPATLAVGWAMLLIVAGVLQPASRESYEFLSSAGKALIDESADKYNERPESQRTTFEAIVHALESQNLLHLVRRVTAIWGEAEQRDQLSEGRHQYRLSVELFEGAPAALEAAGFAMRNRGHVKLEGGDLVSGDSQVNGAKQPVVPGLHFSWLEENPTTAEIDIDYREHNNVSTVFGWGHMAPENSDVRSKVFLGSEHYDLHSQRFGAGLENWWREGP